MTPRFLARPSTPRILLGLLAVFLTTSMASAEPAEPGGGDPPAERESVTGWWILGPADAPLPAFGDGKEHGFALDGLAERWSVDPRWLRPGRTHGAPADGGGDVPWKSLESPDGTIAFQAAGAAPAEAYLGVYLEADVWTTATLEVHSAHPVRAALDGEVLALAAAVPLEGEEAAEGADPGEQADLSLPPGKHRLVVRTVRDAALDEPWSVRVDVAREPGAPAPRITTSPHRPLHITDVLDAPRITGAALSSDGALVAVSLAAGRADGGAERWVEIRRTRDGSVLPNWRGGGGVSRLRWCPAGRRLAYTTADGEGKTTIWSLDLDSGEVVPVVRAVKDLGDYRWSPDGSFVVYSVSVPQEADPRQVDRLLHPMEREPGFRDPSHLVQVFVEGGTSRQLTAGPRGLTGWSIGPRGERILMLYGAPDYSAPPFWKTTLWELELGTLEARQLAADAGIHDAVYSPDGEAIAVLASPSAFGGIGSTVPEGAWSPAWDHQLYLLDAATGDVEAASRELVPGIGGIDWSRADGRIYCLCTEGQYRPLYAFDPASGEWEPLDAGIEVVAGVDLAHAARSAVAFGTGATEPSRLVRIDLRRGRSTVLLQPGDGWYEDVVLGAVEPWTTRLGSGKELDGRVYYPPDFDPEQSYPAIVYYYGGVMPVTRGFGGRYPLNLWAGQGYVVYVPEPSGAVGYGQESSSVHVNDWGEVTAAEVIEGTRAFLQAHPFVDGSRVGCIGASYGGFLTQAILTRTDLFAAGISHAGIASITSYWGVGLWGFEYGAVAMTDSYPWSHEDLFVGRSPLFEADRITTPLLLLHGAEDTNVPRGESDQMFVALTLLGKDVDYVRVEGQDHHILDRDRRIVWSDTILAYFDRHLKGEPGWWEALYPEPGEAP